MRVPDGRLGTIDGFAFVCTTFTGSPRRDAVVICDDGVAKMVSVKDLASARGKP